jgi:hypothetical protein
LASRPASFFDRLAEEVVQLGIGGDDGSLRIDDGTPSSLAAKRP